MSEEGGMPAWAVRGAKIVCIEAEAHFSDRVCQLILGNVYTIRDVAFWSRWTTAPAAFGVWLVEISRLPSREGIVHPYNIKRFRPLVTSTQEGDVALIKSLSLSDPIIRADIYEQEFSEIERELNEAWRR